MEDLKIRLVLEGAEQVQTGATKAGDALGKLGQAGQRAGQQAQLSGNQMAQVSAQLQDLFIQIQGGQAPITALLQQGSQLTTVFGSMGGALRAVGGFAATLITPFTTAAAAVAALGFAYLQGREESSAYSRALILTGNAVGVTAERLQNLAAAQDKIIGTQGQAAQALAALAATGRVAASSLGSAAEAATRLARVGVPLEDTVKKFAALGKEPLKALVDLNEAENFLTEGIYRQVKALTEQGRLTEAAKLAQSTYASEMATRATALEKQLGFLERAWLGVADGAKEAWDAMLAIGRPDTLQQRADKIKAELDALERSRVKSLGASAYSAKPSEYVAALEAELATLNKTIRANDTAAEAKRKAAEAARALAKADEEAAEAARALAKADEEAAKAAKSLAAERDRDTAAVERAVGLSGSYQKQLTELDSLRRRGLLTEQQYIVAVENLIRQQPMVREQLEAQAAVAKTVADAEERGLEIYGRKVAALEQSTDAVAKQVLKLAEEEAALTLSVSANTSLGEAIERVTIARLEEARAKAATAGDYGIERALRAEIEQREKLAGLIGRKEARDAAKRGAEDAAKEWKRTTDEIERSLTDALLRGFESGKGFAANLRDTLVNMFKTMVLRPLIQPIVAQTASGLAALLGLSGNATASTGSALQGVGGTFGGFSIPGQAGTSLASQLGQGVVGALAGLTAGRAISGGFSALGSSGNAAVNIGTIAGSLLGGPIGAAIGGALGGLFNRAFGRGAKEVGDTGLQGTASMGGFAGQAYAQWRQEGGWFRSDKSGTDFSAISVEQDTVLDQGITALYSATEEYAKVLGYPVDALKGYAASFKVALGKTDEENQAAIQAAFVNLGEQLAGRYAAQLAPLQKAGETLSATLQRLANLQGFSNTLGLLGGVFSRVATSSITAREQLIALAGGMDALSQQALGFAQNYYNRDEIAGLKAQELQTAFSAAGIAGTPNSREQFRALVEAQDPNTDAGRKQLAALLALQGSFATVADYLSESGLTLAQAAAQAPTDALTSPLLSSVGQQLQLAQQSMDAQYETRDATLMVVQALGPGGSITAAVERLTNAVAGSRVGGYRQPEVGLAY